MILLDANFLIGVLDPRSAESAEIRSWLGEGRAFCTSAIAWTEFLNGPLLTGHAERVRRIVGGRILPFGEAEASLAAALFNETGRRRSLRFDSVIAAAALAHGAALATRNLGDFSIFEPHGLRLA